jgi:hypothetical protein
MLTNPNYQPKLQNQNYQSDLAPSRPKTKKKKNKQKHPPSKLDMDDDYVWV